MNKSFAVNPNLEINASDLRNLLGKFGIEQARFIGNLPKNWIQNLNTTLEGLPELERARCRLILEKRKDCVRDLYLNMENINTWNDAAYLAKEKKLVEEIITNSGADETLDYREFIFDDEKFPSNVHAHVHPATIESYIEAFKPLIEMSTELFLADRYFSLSWYHKKSTLPQAKLDQQEFLAKLLKSMDRQESQKRLTIFFKRDQSLTKERQSKDITEDIKLVKRKAGCRQVRLGFFLLEDLEHWRYFFSIKGGVQLDKGIFIKDGERSKLTFESSASIRQVFEDYESCIPGITEIA
ncbi:hypothetical protein OAL54_01525 [Gammaproteobacteria bacterium]|nr:hypothetical protein [Gammaproteobacteria bacterium]